jgi:hypothetical protein
MEHLAIIIGSNVLAVSIVSYLLKMWVEKRLSHELSVELEKFKAELAKDIARDSIRRQWTHDKQMNLISSLYSQMVDAEFEIKALLMNLKVGESALIQDRSVKFCEKYLEINSTIHKNELFLDKEVVSEIRAAYQPLFDFAQSYVETGTVTSEVQEQLPRTMDEIFALGDKPRSKMVEIFRKLAGVDA